jgi:PAS domain S-box-containing protein
MESEGDGKINNSGDPLTGERLFQATFEQAAVGMTHVALDGTILRANAALCMILGYSLSELLTFKFQDITYSEDLANDLAQYKQLISGKINNYSMEKRYVRKDGGLIWCRLTVSAARRPDGSTEFSTGVVQDISREKQTEDALKTAKKELEYRVNARTLELQTANLNLQKEVHETEITRNDLKKQNLRIELLQSVTRAANELSAVDAIRTCLQKVCAFTGWSIGHYMQVDPRDADVLLSTNIWYIEKPELLSDFQNRSEKLKFRRGEGVAGWILKTGSSSWIEDLEKDTLFLRKDFALQLNLRGMFAFPILVRNSVVGLIRFFSEKVTKKDQPLLDTMEQIGTQLGRSIERERAAQTIQERERVLSSFFTSSSVMMGVIEIREEEIIHVSDNPTTATFYGTTSEEMRMRSASELGLPRSEVKLWIEHLRQCERSGHPVRFEYETRYRGKSRWGSVSVNFIGIGEKQCPRFSYVVLDITERRRAETRSTLLDKASTAISAPLEYGNSLEKLAKSTIPDFADGCIIDLQVGPQKLRRVAIAHMDPEKEAIIRTKLMNYPPRFDLPHPIVGVISEGELFFQSEFDDDILRRIAYNQVHLKLLESIQIRSLLIVPIQGRGGILGVLSLGISSPDRQYETSDIKTAEELAWRASLAIENETLYLKAKEAVRLRDDFLSIVSHDLKNPLAAIRLNAQLLDRLPLNGKSDNIIIKTGSLIEESVDVMTNLVNDLLDIGRIESNRLTLVPSLADPTDLINKTLQILRPIANSKKISISQEVRASAPVWCDAHKIAQVLSNLVGNAIKFTPMGGTIEIGADETLAGVRFYVKDSGPGISHDHLEHIFDKYWQMKETSRKGTGLGLYIAKGIIEAHQGKIGVESELGQGSTFWFILSTEKIPHISSARESA